MNYLYIYMLSYPPIYFQIYLVIYYLFHCFLSSNIGQPYDPVCDTIGSQELNRSYLSGTIAVGPTAGLLINPCDIHHTQCRTGDYSSLVERESVSLLCFLFGQLIIYQQREWMCR